MKKQLLAAFFNSSNSNRSLPSMPPDTLGMVKQVTQFVASESQIFAIIGLLIVMVIGVVYIVKTH